MDAGDMCRSLIEWFQTINLKVPHSSPDELSNGVAFAVALNQFSPESFPDAWLSKIKLDTGSNWRLKMSNLKKVIEGIYDYYGDVLNYSLAEFTRPDAQLIAENSDFGEMEKLLQLILGCAVNCNSKQDYIRQIMNLEVSLQQNIMRALQELETTWQGASLSRNSLSIASFDYKILQEDRDALAQKCFEMEKKILLLTEEKSNLQLEISKLHQQQSSAQTADNIGEDGISIGPVYTGSSRLNDLRRQIEKLTNELIQSETSREDLKLKSQQQEMEIQHMQHRIDEMHKTVAELGILKDEVDFLRESNDKLKVCESQLESYKKKLEEYNDLKKHIKMLEQSSEDYMQQNIHFEEEVKKYTALKVQMDLYKRELQELNSKLDDALSKNVKLEFDNKNHQNTINELQRAKDSLLKERDNLREALDELKCIHLTTHSERILSYLDTNEATMSRELQPSSLLRCLESANKALREGQDGQRQLLDEARKANQSLREQLREANQKLFSLSHSSGIDPNLKELTADNQIKALMEINEQKNTQLEESATISANLQAKIAQLETALGNREQDILAWEIKYKKCIEKAKEIIKNCDPRAANALDASLQERAEDKPVVSPLEEKLMASAFYRLGLHAQRDAIDTKIALLMNQGQTFLVRQRQSTPRKLAHKSK